MLIIGHRGAKGLAPENTVSSFRKAEEFGVDMIEIDIRRIGGELVATHGRKFRSKKFPTLAEILKISKTPLNLEIKEPGFEKELLSAIRNFSSEVLISSKHPKVLKKIRALDEKIKLALVLGKANFFLLASIRKLDQSLNLHSVHPKIFLVKKPIIQRLKKLNKKIFVWTVNDPKKFAKLKSLKIDGVFTDYPNLIKN